MRLDNPDLRRRALPITRLRTPPLCSAPTMRDVRLQNDLLYAMLGAVLPYASVFFRQAGLSSADVGCASATRSGAPIVPPVLITYVADTLMDARRLIAPAQVVSGESLLALGF